MTIEELKALADKPGDLAFMQTKEALYVLAPEILALVEAVGAVTDWHEDDFGLLGVKDCLDAFNAKLEKL